MVGSLQYGLSQVLVGQLQLLYKEAYTYFSNLCLRDDDKYLPQCTNWIKYLPGTEVITGPADPGYSMLVDSPPRYQVCPVATALDGRNSTGRSA